MKRLSMLLLASLVSFGGMAFAAPWAVDNSHAAAVFNVTHLGFSKTWGRFNKISGTVEPGDAPKVSIEIDAASIDTNDAKRDEHLRGPDFFDVKQFPKLTFTSTAATKTGEGAWDVTGDFTMHGVTKSITVKVTKNGEGKDPWGNTRAGFDAAFSIKRSDYGMNFMPGGIGDEIPIMISLEAIQPK